MSKMAKKSAPTTPNIRSKPNGNILTFFKKAAAKDDDSLFISGGTAFPSDYGNDNSDIFNNDTWEDHSNIKRRKVSCSSDVSEKQDILPHRACTPPPPELVSVSGSLRTLPVNGKSSELKKRSMPFEVDSDSDDDESLFDEKRLSSRDSGVEQSDMTWQGGYQENLVPPSSGDFEGFENIEDFEDEDMEQGEELEERRRALLELEQQEDLSGNTTGEAEEEITCPICSLNLTGSSEQDVSIHVNGCLDGQSAPAAPAAPDPTPPAPRPAPPSFVIPRKSEPEYQPLRAPKPGQKDPASVTTVASSGSSAFSKLMAGHAEDAAWKAAAAAEAAARGRPSYERTCPFYKILPGFSICVDAFRYGAVEGCNAYFLSHFHSDHYIGLTPTWTHGPIYCSKVTANLVKQQLRVDPRWVISLDWETEIEVPGTKGAKVRMISANHCPGSSLFLFEKALSPQKTQRILHCGDFRACRAHLEHPHLQPNVFDAATKISRQQKIDICYLDTTYLNSKYAFPAQSEVISACAELCVKLKNASPEDVPSLLPQSKESSAMRKFITTKADSNDNSTGSIHVKRPGRLLVVIGTYSIGKENICVGIAQALNTKIYAPAAKQRICACLEDPELSSRLTSDPREAQVHMTPLFEIRPETLDDYLQGYLVGDNDSSRCFTHIVGFRPTGWTYRPSETKNQNPETMDTATLLGCRTSYEMNDLKPTRGSTHRSSCYGVPYSEHSSFRELAAFVCGLRIERVIPTVNVGSAKSRERMRAWVARWESERRKNGLFDPKLF